MNKLLLKENFSSENLWKKVNMLTEEQLNKISTGLDWTVSNIPSAVLVGGTAVIHYITGARDLTPDLDFLVKDIDIVKSKLSYDNLRFGELNPGYHEPIGITADDLNTDYLDPEAVNPTLNRLILQTSIKGVVGGHGVNIINPELLAIQKIDLSREKDVNDGFKLLSSGKVNRAKYVSYLNQLKSSLNDYDGLISYKNFIP
jgi:hypothetical protein